VSKSYFTSLFLGQKHQYPEVKRKPSSLMYVTWWCFVAFLTLFSFSSTTSFLRLPFFFLPSLYPIQYLSFYILIQHIQEILFVLSQFQFSCLQFYSIFYTFFTFFNLFSSLFTVPPAFFGYLLSFCFTCIPFLTFSFCIRIQLIQEMLFVLSLFPFSFLQFHSIFHF